MMTGQMSFTSFFRRSITNLTLMIISFKNQLSYLFKCFTSDIPLVLQILYTPFLGFRFLLQEFTCFAIHLTDFYFNIISSILQNLVQLFKCSLTINYFTFYFVSSYNQTSKTVSLIYSLMNQYSIESLCKLPLFRTVSNQTFQLIFPVL